MIKPVSEIVAAAKAASHCLSAEDALKLYRETENALLLDVREPIETQSGTLEGSVNIPRGVLEMKISELCQDPDRPLFIHCATGGRAALSALSLKDMGFTRIVVIDGDYASLEKIFAKGV